MSKSKKNFTDPLLLIEKYGSDALRFYLASSPLMNAEDLAFSDKGLEEVYRKVIVILDNIHNFYLMYGKDSKNKDITDKWIISKLNLLIKNLTENYEEYNLFKACSEIKTFLDELSTWYVRINRDRFNDEESAGVLGEVLNKLSKVIAPIMPFISERIFLTFSKTSVHLEDWPNSNSLLINRDLNLKMDLVREIVSKGLKERDKAQIGLKWPLASAKILVNQNLKDFEDLIKSQLNVKKLIFEESIKHDVSLDFKLNEELEAEGYAREISRQVQAFRKDLGLNKKDEIKLTIESDNNFLEILDKNKELIKERTGAKILDFTTEGKQTFKKRKEFVIKEKKGYIYVD